MLEFVDEQGWNDDSVVKLLLSFIETRQSYWPDNLTMEADLRSFLGNVAAEENSWTNVEGEGPDGWVFVDDESEEEVGFAQPTEYRSADDAVDRFGRSYGDGDFSVYFRCGGKLFTCAAEDTPAQFGYFVKGEKVHVDRDDPQWGRIAEDGEVVEVQDDKVLVLVGGNIRANVLCDFDEVYPYNDPE
jgi:hypothetical protein